MPKRALNKYSAKEKVCFSFVCRVLSLLRKVIKTDCEFFGEGDEVCGRFF